MGVGLICLCWLLLVIAFTEQELCQFLYERLPTKITRRLNFVMNFVMKYVVHNKSHSE